MRDILALRSTNPNRKIEVNRKSQALKVRKPSTAKCREKKRFFMSLNTIFGNVFLSFELKCMMYITILL